MNKTKNNKCKRHGAETQRLCGSVFQDLQRRTATKIIPEANACIAFDLHVLFVSNVFPLSFPCLSSCASTNGLFTPAR